MDAARLQNFLSQLVLAEEDGSDMPEGEREAPVQDLVLCRCADCPLVFVEQSLAEFPLRAIARVIIEVDNVVADGMTVQDVQEHAVRNAADHRFQASFRLETQLRLAVVLAGAAALPGKPMVEIDLLRHRGFTHPCVERALALAADGLSLRISRGMCGRSLMTTPDIPSRSRVPGRQTPE
jgi:hypothetical protein